MSLRAAASRRFLATASAKPKTSKSPGSPIATEYARLAKQWPTDPLRPSLQFASLLSHRQSLFESPGKSESADAPSAAQSSPDEALERQRLSALVSLLEDRAAIKVCFKTAWNSRERRLMCTEPRPGVPPPTRVQPRPLHRPHERH
jgi:hypothetical protein